MGITGNEIIKLQKCTIGRATFFKQEETGPHEKAGSAALSVGSSRSLGILVMFLRIN